MGVRGSGVPALACLAGCDVRGPFVAALLLPIDTPSRSGVLGCKCKAAGCIVWHRGGTLWGMHTMCGCTALGRMCKFQVAER